VAVEALASFSFSSFSSFSFSFSCISLSSFSLSESSRSACESVRSLRLTLFLRGSCEAESFRHPKVRVLRMVAIALAAPCEGSRSLSSLSLLPLLSDMATNRRMALSEQANTNSEGCLHLRELKRQRVSRSA